MTEAEAEILATSPRRRPAGPLTGMTCAMVGALALCIAGDCIFFMYPNLNDVWKSVKVDLPTSTRFILASGPWMWLALAVGGVVSFGMAFRRPGRPLALAVNVTMCVSAIWLAYLAKHGAMSPLANLFLDLVDPGREVPRHN